MTPRGELPHLSRRSKLPPPSPSTIQKQVAGSGLEQCASFRYVRDRIGEWIEATFSDDP